MALEPSAYNSRKSFSSAFGLYSLFALCFLILPSSILKAQGTKAYKSFPEARGALLSAISGAKQRVWLVSDYITDGEIVGALHVARYRKLDVATLIGKEKANAYLSRYGYLQKNGILVKYRPARFPFNSPTLLLVDKTLYKLDSDLNFLTTRKSFRLVEGQAEEANMFATAFWVAATENNKSVSQVPLAVESGHNKNKVNVTRGLSKENSVRVVQPAPSVAYSGDAYNYDYAGRQVGQQARGEAPKHLPKLPLYMKNQRASSVAMEGPNTMEQDRLLNPLTAREPLIRSPKSPESN